MANEPPRPSHDPFARLRQATPARIGLGRAGQSLPTAALLDFQLAHARARDAVNAVTDVEALRSAIDAPTIVVESAASSRLEYLHDPGLGRRLAEAAPPLTRGDYDLVIVVADGLSATAVNAHAPAVVAALIARLGDWRMAPVVVAKQGRVAIGDPIGEELGARSAVVLIGERPGLSAADSLGAYITWHPIRGRRDSERNCVSNIRTTGGLSPQHAADRIATVLREARRLGLSGVLLKDRRDIVDQLE